MAPSILINPTCAALTTTLKKIPTTAMKRQCHIKSHSESNLTNAAAIANETYSTAGDYFIGGHPAKGGTDHAATMPGITRAMPRKRINKFGIQRKLNVK